MTSLRRHLKSPLALSLLAIHDLNLMSLLFTVAMPSVYLLECHRISGSIGIEIPGND